MTENIAYLPDELLGLLFRTVGLKAALASLPGNRKLHTAWQATVQSVSIPASTLRVDDINILSKLVGLEKLRFHGGTPGAVPVWRVAGTVARSLTRLRSLTLDQVPSGFTAFRNIAYAEGFATRLQELTINDAQHALCADDLLAMAHLEALTCLDLETMGMASSAEELRDVCSQVTCLAALKWRVHKSLVVPAGTLAVLPGSLTSLTALVLQSSKPHTPSAHTGQQVAGAVSALTNLKDLDTNWALDTVEVQQQALGQLKQLTQLRIDHTGAPAAPLQPFTMTTALPELQAICIQAYVLEDPFQHPKLRKCLVGRLQAGEQWINGTAEDCNIVGLAIGTPVEPVDEAAFRNMPLLPRLERVAMIGTSTNGRFLHLASLLQRQASRLTLLHLDMCKPFQELLPKELPVCSILRLVNGGVSRTMLMLLSTCSMPTLAELRLDLTAVQLAELVVEADLGWLKSLPELQTLELRVSGAGAAAFKSSVAALLQGTHVALKWL